LKGSLHPNEPVVVSLQDGKLVFKQKASPAAATEPLSS
jgi:hypothetical protein